MPPLQRPPTELPNLTAKPARMLDFTFMTLSSCTRAHRTSIRRPHAGKFRSGFAAANGFGGKPPIHSKRSPLLEGHIRIQPN